MRKLLFNLVDISCIVGYTYLYNFWYDKLRKSHHQPWKTAVTSTISCQQKWETQVQEFSQDGANHEEIQERIIIRGRRKKQIETYSKNYVNNQLINSTLGMVSPLEIENQSIQKYLFFFDTL